MSVTIHSLAARIRQYRLSGVGLLCCYILPIQTASAHIVKDTVPAGGSVDFYWTDNNGNQINPALRVTNSTGQAKKVSFNTNAPLAPQFANASDWHQTVNYANGKSTVYSGNLQGNSPWELLPLNDLPDVTWRIPDLGPNSGGDTELTIYAAVNLDIYLNNNPTGFLNGDWEIGDTLSSLSYTISNGVGSDGVQGILWTTAPITFDSDENGPGFRTANSAAHFSTSPLCVHNKKRKEMVTVPISFYFLL